MPLQVASPDVIAECRDILRKAEEIVGPEKFGILTDFFVLDMSQAEIAAKHGKTELSIKLKIFRALEEIARSLGISRNQAKT
jgi:DNA-directed RNA polymerase specialized sigma24 family protein